ncbi:MAG: META domain-containing protein [bacterium]|nr:META domain-containing protein [bacterium]
MKKVHVFITMILVGLCFTAVVSTTATAAGSLTLDQLKNGTYQGIYDRPVQLTDGIYEGEPFEEGGASRPTVTCVEELVAFGDLNGDGVEDAAVVVIENSGGSGNFRYLAVMLSQNDQSVNEATMLIGDRVQLRSLTIHNGQIGIEIITQDEGDSMPFPSLKMRTTYELQGKQLVEVSSEKLGSVSIQDLEGPTWVLTKLNFDRAVLPDTEITATFAEDKVSGSAGCNKYSATVTDKGSAALSIDLPISTRMACPDPIMQQEDTYLNRLTKVIQFSFSAGQLVLMYDTGETSGAFLLKPHADLSSN